MTQLPDPPPEYLRDEPARSSGAGAGSRAARGEPRVVIVGGGIMAAPGRNAALHVLSDLRLRRRAS